MVAQQRWCRNVRLVFAYSFLSDMTKSLWNATIMSTYVFLQTGSEAKVGYATGVQGTAQALMAPLGALLSDKGGRAAALRVGGAAGLVSIAATAAAVLRGGDFGVLCCALAAWGVTWGVTDPGVEALFADSVPRGQRSGIYTAKYILTLLAGAAGPLVSIVLFLAMGDTWSPQACGTAILVGVALSVAPCALLFAFREPLPAPASAAADALAGGATPAELAMPLLSGSGTDDDDDTESGSTSSDELKPPPAAKEGMTGAAAAPAAAPVGVAVPAAVALSDVLTNLASGMSIRFFPIFFMQDVALSPVAVSAVYAVNPLLTSGAAALAQRVLAPRVGRAAASMSVKIVGVGLLVLMCVMRWWGGGAAGWSRVALILVYLARTALMNCSKPLTRSIIMDTVPAHQRARWSALESLSTAGWSGSAVVGGLLVERYGLLTNFVTTATLQALSLAPLLYVASHEPCERHHATAAAEVALAAVHSDKEAAAPQVRLA